MDPQLLGLLGMILQAQEALLRDVLALGRQNSESLAFVIEARRRFEELSVEGGNV